VQDLRDLGYKVGGENKDAPAYGSAMLGPKIGNGFYQNLRENYNMLTADMWFRRMAGRYLGKVLRGDDPFVENQAERLRDALRDPEWSDHPVIHRLRRHPDEFGYTLSQARRDPIALADLAGRLHDHFAAGGYKPKHELHNAAKELDNTLWKPTDRLSGGAERDMYRQAVRHALGHLAETGYPGIDVAGLQALLWYPEKDLYATLGYKNPRAESTDYGTAYGGIAQNKGYTEKQIEQALRRAGRGR
jgi:hypothetical protein